MRNILFSFLVLLMITPSLACAMPSCADEKQQAEVKQPCAGHHSEQDKKDTNKVNLLVDCMGVDLQKADTASMDKPDFKTDFVVYAPYNEPVTSLTLSSSADTIRGPPERANLLPQTLPIFMTTQRFRI